MSTPPEEPCELNPNVSFRRLSQGLERLAGMRVAVVGETIIDEYTYCDAIGKSGKEPMLVSRYLRCEVQAGGVLAIANHLADFCAEVELVSALGSFERREDFVRRSLRSNVRPTFVTKPESPTIVKRRYIDALTRSKLLGVYQINAERMADPGPLCSALESVAARVDAIVVADYGHGLLEAPAIEVLTDSAPFLAINTQINAANHGYNVLSKYPRFDFACVHEGELRLDARDAHGPLEPLLEQAIRRAQARAIMVTRGWRGTTLMDNEGNVERCPALAEKVVERVGAGDAVLALSSVGMAAGLELGVVSVAANLGGAQAVAVVGNSSSIRKETLLNHAERVLPATTAPRLCAGGMP